MGSEVWKSEPQHTVLELMATRLESDPDGPYLDVCGTELTAAEVHRAAASLARALVELGVERGDRVATLIENSPEAMLAWWGALTAGAVAVPVNTAYKGIYLAHQLADSGSKVLVVAASLADRLARVLPDLPELGHVIVVGASDAPMPGATCHDWDSVLTTDPTPPKVEVRPADLATFIYTGGTTGPSKGCMLSHHYHGALASQIGICWRRTADDVVWTPLPLFHFNAISTAVVGALVYGGRAAIHGRFSVSNFW
ncbi:MAG TPA: AMP-binding protein, partial [Acidimicrobiales bacterium]|nr:AMP-binding protein [Acidimicrobiales bacterium]